MTAPIQARKRGRPPKFLGSEERVPRSLRLMPDIDARVREAAESNNRSVAEELEHRIGLSFEYSDNHADEVEKYGRIIRKLVAVKTLDDLMSQSLAYARESMRIEEKKYIAKLQMLIYKHRTSIIGRFKSIIGNRHNKYLPFEEDVSSLEIDNGERRIKELNERDHYLRTEIYNIHQRIETVRLEFSDVLKEEDEASVSFDLKMLDLKSADLETGYLMQRSLKKASP